MLPEQELPLTGPPEGESVGLGENRMEESGRQRSLVAMKRCSCLGPGIAVMLGMLGAGCSSGPRLERLDAAAFTAMAGQVGTMASAHETRFIGATPGRVYLERERVAYSGRGTVTTVYWTGRADLPPGVLAALEARGGRRATMPRASTLPPGAREPVGRLRGALDAQLDQAERLLGDKLDELGSE